MVGLLLYLTVGTNIARAGSAAGVAKRYVRDAIEFRDQLAGHLGALQGAAR